MGKFDSAGDILSFIFAHNYCAFTASLTNQRAFPYLDEFVGTPSAKVISDRQGRAHLLRATGSGHETRWVVKIDSWDEEADPPMLKRMDDIYKQVGIGYYPTPSSLGMGLMRAIWSQYGIQQHTALPLACESFIQNKSVGGIVQNNCVGKHFDELLYLDLTSAYLSKFTILPTGTASWFRGRGYENLATWFARCTVFVPSDLALGPFPVVKQRRKDWRRRVQYPTLGGTYETYLWREQAEACALAGCDVQVHEGWGWPEFTSDTLRWCQEAYWLRQVSMQPWVEAGIKKSIVGAIGHHSMSRTHWYLVDEKRRRPEDTEVVTDDGDAINMYVREEWDAHSAYMTHWGEYTRMLCNLGVYQFALPYAERGTLVKIDFDSVMTLETDGAHQFIQKHSYEEALCPAGSWTYMLLHDVDIVTKRGFKSKELTRLPGGYTNEPNKRNLAKAG